MLTRKSLAKYIDRPGVIYNDKKHVNCSTRKRISVNYWIREILTKLGIINVAPINISQRHDFKLCITKDIQPQTNQKNVNTIASCLSPISFAKTIYSK